MPNWFIAWPVTAGPWFNAALREAPASLRRFHPADLHITLSFLGGCGAAAAAAAWALAEALPAQALSVRLGPVRGFGDPRRPSAWSVEVEGEEIRALLAEHRNTLAEAAGARPERRPPRPHLTLGRPGRGSEHAALARWAEGLGALGDPLRLDRLALYTWAEDRGRQQFQIAASRSLAS